VNCSVESLFLQNGLHIAKLLFFRSKPGDAFSSSAELVNTLMEARDGKWMTNYLNKLKKISITDY